MRAPTALGDLEGVREEVALGVAEVGAVEPHVARVEDAVEHQPSCEPRPPSPPSPSPAPAPAGGVANVVRYRSGPSAPAKAGVERQCPGTVTGSQPPSSKPGSGYAPAEVLVGEARPATTNDGSPALAPLVSHVRTLPASADDASPGRSRLAGPGSPRTGTIAPAIVGA